MKNTQGQKEDRHSQLDVSLPPAAASEIRGGPGDAEGHQRCLTHFTQGKSNKEEVLEHVTHCSSLNNLV